MDRDTVKMMAATIAAGLVQRVYDTNHSDGYYEPDEDVVRDSVTLAISICEEADRQVDEWTKADVERRYPHSVRSGPLCRQCGRPEMSTAHDPAHGSHAFQAP